MSQGESRVSSSIQPSMLAVSIPAWSITLKVYSPLGSCPSSIDPSDHADGTTSGRRRRTRKPGMRLPKHPYSTGFATNLVHSAMATKPTHNKSHGEMPANSSGR